nr:ERAD-associated E3 ubiquitin-protein ligase HRD1B [Fagopyrum tataricum]
MMKLQTYAALSLFATLAVIYHAFHSRFQFYPATVYLSTSKISLVLLLNMGLVIMCGLWQLTKKIFLGSLREAEVERLNEQSWREVMEILFAITIFRQDFSVSFLAMVAALLLIKALHWMAQKRVEYIETTPAVTRISHIRIVSFMGFLLLIDSLFLYSYLRHLIETRQASVSLFFSFEYMILATTTVATFVKYLFYVCDVLMEGQWEKKPVYTFYLELIRDLLHLSMYLCFFMVIFVNYGVPLHLIRELYETFRNFKIRVADYIRYRKITSNMNDRFPDATPEELNVSDATCIICREEMTTAKKLICGHLFHVHCLRSWLERQHTCPTCRAHVIPSETGTSSSVGPHAQPNNSNQPASASTSGGQSSNVGGTADDNMSRNARLQAAATAAASIYEKSFVYPAASTLVWTPGNAMVPQAHGQFPDSTTRGSGEEHLAGGNTSSSLSQIPQSAFLGFQVPGFDNHNQILTASEFDNHKKALEHQIEVLQSQLQHLVTTRQGEVAPAVSSQDKGKAVASSSVSDCGSHGEVEEAASL